MNNPKGPGTLFLLGIGIVLGVILAVILIYVLRATPNEVNIGPINFRFPNAAAVTLEPVEPAPEPALSRVISTVEVTKIVEKPVVQTVVVEKSVPQTVIVEKKVAQIVEKPVTVVVEKPVEKEVTVPVPQTVIVAVAPSATPLPPTPAMTLPFEDDFTNRMRPEWEVVAGEWRVVNDKLTTISRNDEWSRLYLGDPQWRNYTIEADVHSMSQQKIGIMVRVQDIDNRMLFLFATDNVAEWLLCQKGECTLLAETSGSLNYIGIGVPKKVKVEVRDDVFTAYLNGTRVLAVNDLTFPTGKVGVQIACNDSSECNTIDNFKISPLP